MATHKNLKASVRTITRATTKIRNGTGNTDWIALAGRIDSLLSRARNTYGEDMETECDVLTAELLDAKDAAADWKVERLAFAARRVTPVRELSPIELSYAAELRAMR